MPITVDRFLQACAAQLGLKVLAGAAGLAREITDQRVQKAGLAMTGEVKSIHQGRIQVMGETEVTYFEGQPQVRQIAISDAFFSGPMACAVAGGSLPVSPILLAAADKHGVPVLSSPLPTTELIEEMLKALGRIFAETATVHGVMMDVLGLGVLLQGPSGIGKSECALDLILRGHRIVADDIIHLEKRGPSTILGRGSDLTRHHMEIRGLGIISLRDLFGLSAITDLKKVEVVIRIEEWDPGKEYDRLGLEDRRTPILGVSLPTLLIPISPGRNLATIVEVAVRNHILKTQGVHAARELVERQSRRTEEGTPR
ncbi:MAG: HPr(Ser) kinase/phosphatase [Deltaproteobacteria bacterium]|nr:HPr(Ser) kinase/phosphatase [Deltaproteobacteria bacterium]